MTRGIAVVVLLSPSKTMAGRSSWQTRGINHFPADRDRFFSAPGDLHNQLKRLQQGGMGVSMRPSYRGLLKTPVFEITNIATARVQKTAARSIHSQA